MKMSLKHYNIEKIRFLNKYLNKEERMKFQILIYGNPVLRKKSVPITEFNEDLKKLSEDMIETMMNADGVGLAAPQIGKNIRIVIVDPDPSQNGLTRMILVNPEITPITENKEVMEEGCLSVPGIYGRVKRPTDLRVKAQDLDGKPIEFETRGFFSRVIQHEIDHLDGVIFTDKVLPKDKKKVEKELKELIAKYA